MIGEKEYVDGLTRTEFCPKTKQKASMLLTLMMKPSFIVGLVTTDEFMHRLIKPTAAMQSKSDFDILGAYMIMDSVIKVWN